MFSNENKFLWKPPPPKLVTKFVTLLFSLIGFFCELFMFVMFSCVCFCYMCGWTESHAHFNTNCVAALPNLPKLYCIKVIFFLVFISFSLVLLQNLVSDNIWILDSDLNHQISKRNQTGSFLFCHVHVYFILYPIFSIYSSRRFGFFTQYSTLCSFIFNLLSRF